MATSVKAGENFLEKIPENPDISKNYLIYLHGAIIERGDLTPIHPNFGLYNMPAIREALGNEEGTILISDHRPPNTKSPAYAKKLAKDIEGLLEAGVSPEKITISGFSKGGGIAILTSSYLKNKNINFVFMAACNTWAFNNKQIKVMGRILSIHEVTDNIGISCQPLIDKSSGVIKFKEIALNTGKKHGAFYLPRSVWVKPLKAWAKN